MTTNGIEYEQAYVSKLYDRLDELHAQAEDRLAAVLRDEGSGTPQARSERDAATARIGEQIARLRAAEVGLCFGRLDLEDGERRYVGRLGIFDEDADYAPLLLDWRAPAARPFYVATAVSPEGVRRRRHIRTRNRDVIDVQDEVLTLDATDRVGVAGGPGSQPQPAGEAALLAALTAERTGRMRDIVATIQAEQDRVIRGDHRGALVVEGGPGTGKTAVALHRAAYLLYTHRQELTTRGVLIVGPNATFLRYIDQVLPSLGETGVLLSTIGELYPGVSAAGEDPPEVAELKGRPVMADVLAEAVRDRQRLPDDVREIVVSDTHAGLGYQPDTLQLDRSACERARARARASRRPHNQARAVFADQVVGALARQLADRLGADPYADDPLGENDAPGVGQSLLGEADVVAIARELRDDPAVRAAIDELWPVLTPPRLLADLFASAQRLTAAALQLTEAERKLLRRDPDADWAVVDVPLLDEAAELLGEDDEAARVRERRRQEAEVEYARGVLDISAGSYSIDAEDEADPEVLDPRDVIAAEELAQRHERRDHRTTAELAAADRRWAFGHVIVDEAQELSPMAWRLLMRRCPSRSMTLVGDLDQTTEPAGGQPWAEVLAPYLADRWRMARLTVNYRTPAEVMALAGEVLAAGEPPRSVRHSGVAPWRQEFGEAELAGQLPELVAREAAEVGKGKLAVIVPSALLAPLAGAITAGVPDAAAGSEPAALDRTVALLTVRQAKGLEFDSVIVVEPGQILAESPRGHNNLYVALTRTTRRLGVIHCGDLPTALAPLHPRRP